MFNTFFGLKVLRAIPQETIWGLLSRQYVLHSGVIRGAPGTAQAGQIVRHLIPLAPPEQIFPPLSPLPNLPTPMSIYQLAQLREISTMTNQVLQLATTTTILSGLNLAVSAIGFAHLSHRLSAIETRLEAIQADVKAIRAFLERRERAELQVALQNLRDSHLIANDAIRHQVLVNAHQAFGVMLASYRELLTSATEAEPALIAEEYYCLTMLARAHCSANLDQLALAHQELRSDLAVWTEQARRIAHDLLLGEHPERFLYLDTAQVAPTSALVDWLDFAHNDSKGYGWIDDLRSKMRHWHADKSTRVGIRWGDSKEQERTYDCETVVPSLARLTARQRTLEGHVAQLALLAELNITPSTFERRLVQLEPSAVEGYLIV
jgi:hypothetical protein